MKKKLLLTCLLLLIIFLASCAKAETAETKTAPTAGVSATRTEESSAPETEPEKTEPEEEPEEIVAPLFPDRYPMAFMVNNTPQARPQSGLASAKLIYQMMTEARTTRFLLLTDQEEGVVGPIRSARPAYLDLVAQHQAFYTYAGNYRVIEASPVKDDIRILDALKGSYDLFYRTDHRVAPHNLYTKLEDCYRRAEKTYGSIHFSEESGDLRARDRFLLPQGGQPAVRLHYQYNVLKESFRYQIDRKAYVKYNGEDLLVDEVTDEVLQISNIIILHPPHGLMPNGSHIRIDWLGQGQALYLTGGRKYDIRWEKSSHTSPIRYFLDQEELILNPGLTWILVMDGRALDTLQFP